MEPCEIAGLLRRDTLTTTRLLVLQKERQQQGRPVALDGAAVDKMTVLLDHVVVVAGGQASRARRAWLPSSLRALSRSIFLVAALPSMYATTLCGLRSAGRCGPLRPNGRPVGLRAASSIWHGCAVCSCSTTSCATQKGESPWQDRMILFSSSVRLTGNC